MLEEEAHVFFLHFQARKDASRLACDQVLGSTTLRVEPNRIDNHKSAAGLRLSLDRVLDLASPSEAAALGVHVEQKEPGQSAPFRSAIYHQTAGDTNLCGIRAAVGEREHAATSA